MTRKFTLLLQFAVALLLFPASALAHTDWKGSYTFDEDGGKNAGGSAIFISHELTISDGGEGLVATLESNGYQTSSNLICKAKAEGSKLLIYFQSYGENNMFEPYKEGDLLLTLESTVAKGILTHWGKFTASIPKNQKSGRSYFSKVPDKNL
ncbi:MAG TPA: DUF5991 domain-containing protein [Pyrinomonadaceae bacterium]